MRRITISELVRETGLSRATIDRALNKRNGIHPRTESVINEAIERLKMQDAKPTKKMTNKQADIDGIFQLGVGLTTILQSAISAAELPIKFHNMYQKSEEEILECITDCCKDLSRPLIITAKNTERLNIQLTKARENGKRIIAFISDLRSESRDACIGIDNRMAGQAAAYLTGAILGSQHPATAGVILGDYAFNCHEDREIGFRSHLRAHFPDIALADVTLAQGEDAPEQTYQSVMALLKKHPNISAIYNVGGGNQGLARALQQSGFKGKICVITHEADHITIPLLQNDILQYVIAQSPSELLKKAVDLATAPETGLQKEQNYIDFGLYTKFNIPRFEY